MKNKTLKKTVFSAVFTALIFASTYVVKIPSPTNGYVNLGDGFVLVSGWLLGPVFGAVSSGLGSCLTDIVSGYAVYAPATFIIKALVSVVSCLIYKLFKQKTLGLVVGGIVAEIFMALSYFGFSAVLLGNAVSAALGILGDLFQGAVGVTLGVLIMKILKRTKLDSLIKGEN